MEIKRTESIKASVGKDAHTSVYVCTWNEKVQLEIGDFDSNGVWHEFEMTVPLAVGRVLSEELVEDIAEYDAKKEKEEMEAAAEAAEEALNNDDTNS
tara:strand:+ start:463 stop:753 length:291 start_codon:yes stop_codon:yes gene_type:complete